MNTLLKISLPICLAALINVVAVVPMNAFAAFGIMPEIKPQTVHPGMFSLYEDNRTKGIPNYITEDFLILAYGMIRKEAVLDLEQNVLIPALNDFLSGLEKAFEKGTAPGDESNRQFIALIKSLANGIETPKDLNKAALEELELIRRAQGINISSLWGYPIDYSQMKPRGIYADNSARKQYFQAIKYGSLVLFPVKESQSTGITAHMADSMTADAAALVSAIIGDPDLMAAYDKLDALLTFNFGPSDDLSLADFTNVLKRHPEMNQTSAVSELRKALFDYAKTNDRRPSIIAGIVDASKLEKKMTAQDVLTGFRLFPSRYSLDSAVFQDLVYPNVGQFKGKGTPFGLALIGGKEVKGFPSALELMSLLGSKKALDMISMDGVKSFENYDRAYYSIAANSLNKAGGVSQLHLGLMGLWLGTNNIISSINDDSAARKLTSMLSFWTWQRYIGVLYQKQSTTATAKGGIPLYSKVRQGAYLEPAVELYLALSYLVDQHDKNSLYEGWKEFKTVLDRCVLIAFKEKNRAKLTLSDEQFLNSLDLILKQLTKGQDHPIVVDVHTEPSSGKVVEEAIGYPNEINRLGARGALFTHYEFKHAMKDRLDDKSWEILLTSPKRPKTSVWQR